MLILSGLLHFLYAQQLRLDEVKFNAVALMIDAFSKEFFARFSNAKKRFPYLHENRFDVIYTKKFCLGFGCFDCREISAVQKFETLVKLF